MAADPAAHTRTPNAMDRRMGATVPDLGPRESAVAAAPPPLSAEPRPVGLDPVTGDQPLRASQRDPPGTDLVVQPILEAVLLVTAWTRRRGLGEQVRRRVGAAELERHEVVDLAVGSVEMPCDPIGAVDGVLARLRHVPDAARVAGCADPPLVDQAIARAGRAACVWQGSTDATAAVLRYGMQRDRGPEPAACRQRSGQPACDLPCDGSRVNDRQL